MLKRIAFDIGCNVGKYTDVLIKNGYDYVVAVDPNPYLFISSPFNTYDNKLIRVIEAISDKEGEIPFYFCNADTISTAHIDWTTRSRFANREYIWKPFKVKATTIDKLVEIYGIPDHIKLDVEGYEEEALKGMTRKYAETLCFEWAEEEYESALRCVDYLASLGYTEFGWLETDPYYIQPNIYYNLDEFKSLFKYDEKRKEKWGMIWAK